MSSQLQFVQAREDHHAELYQQPLTPEERQELNEWIDEQDRQFLNRELLTVPTGHTFEAGVNRYANRQNDANPSS